ncbi:hypothetical protein ACIRQY_10125 [Streptomyces sp. NPDC101490]|uniref:hypothetical protein n=1 Tax=Streptomyces sp. NPDC101490 TaxID=3366143 RepID=UPI00380BC5E2
MRPEHCVTRNHIEVWNNRVLPPGPARIGFWTVLRGSLLPALLWTGALCLVYVGYGVLVGAVLTALLPTPFLVGFGLRRRAGHSVRCAAYGALGGVLDTSMCGL